MSLRVRRTSKIIGRLIKVIVVLFVAGVFAVLVKNEYELAKKDRQPSSTVVVNNSSALPIIVDETEVTEEQRKEYIVALDRPRYLSVDGLGVSNARVVEISVQSDGKLGTPVNIYDVGWYSASGLPGQGGVMLMAAHNGGPTMDGVFKHLNQLGIGDVITVERGDGAILRYEVVESKTMLVEDANDYMGAMMMSAVSGKEGLNLITCTGNWVQNQATYDQRVMMRAVIIDDNDTATSVVETE